MSGSVRYKDLGWRAIVQSISELGRLEVKAGLVGDAAQRMSGRGALTAVEAGAISEYGAPSVNIPRRPFLSSTFERLGHELERRLTAVARASVEDPGSAKSMLAGVGQWMAREIRMTVLSRVPPPNAPSTVRRKGSNHPLIEIGTLLSSIAYQIVSKAGAVLEDGVSEMIAHGLGGTEGADFFGGG